MITEQTALTIAAVVIGPILVTLIAKRLSGAKDKADRDTKPAQ